MSTLRFFALVLTLSAMSSSSLAESVLVFVESVQGDVKVRVDGIDSVAVRPIAGDLLPGPLTIETGNDSNIEIVVRGNTVSITSGSSVVVEDLPYTDQELVKPSNYVDYGQRQRPWRTQISA